MTKIDELTRDAVRNHKAFKCRKTCITNPPGYSILRYDGTVILEYFPHLNEGPLIQVCVPNVKNRTAILNRINAVLSDYDMYLTSATLSLLEYDELVNVFRGMGCLTYDKEYTINLRTKELTCD